MVSFVFLNNYFEIRREILIISADIYMIEIVSALYNKNIDREKSHRLVSLVLTKKLRYNLANLILLIGYVKRAAYGLHIT